MHSTRPFFFSFFLKLFLKGGERGGKQSSRVLRWIIVEKITETVKLIERERGSGKKGCAKSQTGIGLVRLSFAKKREGDEAR